jgi:hypothetical protein
MWADATVVIAPTVTVETKHLETIRKTSPEKPAVKIGATVAPMFRAVVVDVVDGEEAGITLSATGARFAVMLKHCGL